MRVLRCVCYGVRLLPSTRTCGFGNPGNTWQLLRQLDAGPSGYSALTVTPSQDVGILYERSNQTRIVFLPQNISYVVAWKYEPSAL